MVHGLVFEGPFTNDSIINFFSNPSALQTIDSTQSSTALSLIDGLYLKSLAYEFRR